MFLVGISMLHLVFAQYFLGYVVGCRVVARLLLLVIAAHDCEQKCFFPDSISFNVRLIILSHA